MRDEKPADHDDQEEQVPQNPYRYKVKSMKARRQRLNRPLPQQVICQKVTIITSSFLSPPLRYSFSPPLPSPLLISLSSCLPPFISRYLRLVACFLFSFYLAFILFKIEVLNSLFFQFIRRTANLLDKRDSALDCPSAWSQLRQGTHHPKEIPRTA